jgi:TonB family protein
MKFTPGPDPNAVRGADRNLPAGDSVPKLGKRDPSLSQGFIGNVKDFLTERPVRVSGGAEGGAFTVPTFDDGFMANLKEWFKPSPKAIPGGANSLRGADAPGIKVEWQPLYKTFFQNIRDVVAPRKLPPLKVTSQPVKVKDIWTKDEVFSRAQIVSFAVHGALLALLIFGTYKMASTAVKAVNKSDIVIIPVDVSPYTAKLPPAAKKAGGGGGGGEHNPIPASKGMLPKFSMQAQLAPPAIPRNPHPAMMVTPTLIGPDALKVPSPNADRWGDPLAKMVTDSNGSGSGGGMGSGSGGGIGSGNGGGLGPGQGGGTGGGIFNAGTGGVGTPACIYCPRPDYSDEARKAKYQGEVLLSLVVMPTGKASNIEVVKSPGLGLDQKAIEAVRNWQFKPANGPDGKPVPTRITVEVVFQLF